MNFIEHIKRIDKEIELRKEKEYQMTMFGQHDDISGLGFGNSITTRPNIVGGVDIMDGANRIGYTQSNIFGGVDVMNGANKIGYTQPNIFGGYDYKF